MVIVLTSRFILLTIELVSITSFNVIIFYPSSLKYKVLINLKDQLDSMHHIEYFFLLSLDLERLQRHVRQQLLHPQEEYTKRLILYSEYGKGTAHYHGLTHFHHGEIHAHPGGAPHSHSNGEMPAEQGNTAEAQGARAQSIYETVSAWYTAFKQDAENWLSGVQSTWNGWYSSTQSAWNTWFSDTQSAWTAWFNARKAEWTTWFGDTQSAWTAWFNARKAEWNTWFADKQVEWTAWLSARLAELTASYSSAERARDSAYLDAESARDQLYMDAETQRMAAMTQTQCFVDTGTMHLIFVQPENDETEYKVVNGRLNIITYYEDEEIEND